MLRTVGREMCVENWGGRCVLRTVGSGMCVENCGEGDVC